MQFGREDMYVLCAVLALIVNKQSISVWYYLPNSFTEIMMMEGGVYSSRHDNTNEYGISIHLLEQVSDSV